MYRFINSKSVEVKGSKMKKKKKKERDSVVAKNDNNMALVCQGPREGWAEGALAPPTFWCQ